MEGKNQLGSPNIGSPRNIPFLKMDKEKIESDAKNLNESLNKITREEDNSFHRSESLASLDSKKSPKAVDLSKDSTEKLYTLETHGDATELSFR
jgi:hypothetical protein